MSQQVAYAVALSIVGLSGATAYSIITQSGRIEKIQASLRTAKISIKLQPPKQNLVSSHEDLRALLYLSSTNLYSALQSVDSISATVQVEKGMSSLQLQVKLDQILTQACQDDPQVKKIPHSSGDLFQINVVYIGYVTGDVADSRRQSMLVSPHANGNNNGTGSGHNHLIGGDCHDYSHAYNSLQLAGSGSLSEFAMLVNWVDGVPLSNRRRKLVSNLMIDFSNSGRKLPSNTAVAAVGPNLLMFSPKVSDQRAQDFIDSDMFAQSAADYVIEQAHTTIEENQIMWYKEYVRVLKQIGWVVSDSEFAQYQASGSSFSVDKVLIDVLAAVATDNEVKFVSEVMTTLAAGDGGDGFTLWDQTQSNKTSNHFNGGIGYVHPKTGEFHVGNTAMQIKSSTHSTGFLFFHYSKTDTDLQHATTDMRLNERIYARVRDAVEDRLGDHSLDAVLTIPLSKIHQ